MEDLKVERMDQVKGRGGKREEKFRLAILCGIWLGASVGDVEID